MAAKVNIRFVVTLAVVLSVIFLGVAIAGYVVLRKSGSELVALGDQKAAEGNWEEAEGYYGRAVNKERSNPDYLRKWVDAIGHMTPAQTVQYRDRYNKYLAGQMALADTLRTDMEQHRRALDILVDRNRLGAASSGDWEVVIQRAETAMAFFQDGSPEQQKLRFYRGLARTAIAESGTDLPADEREEAEADLAAAVEADPLDERALGTQLVWLGRVAVRERDRGVREKGEAILADIRARGEAFAKAHDPAPFVLFALFQVEASATRAAEPGLPYAAICRRHEAALRRAVDGALRTDPTKLDRLLASQLALTMAGSELDGAADVTERLFAHIEKADPTDPTVLYNRGQAYLTASRPADALAAFERVVQLPTRPVSLLGMLQFSFQDEAAFNMVNAALSLWQQAADEAARGAALERARGLRSAFAARVGETSPMLLLLDGKIKVAEGDFTAARRLLGEYKKQTGANDMGATLLLANVLYEQGNMGAARELFVEVRDANPNNADILERLAYIEASLRNYVAALDMWEQVARLRPDHPTARQQIDVLVRIGQGERGEDPVVRLLNQVEKITSGAKPDYAQAMRLLNEAYEASTWDARIGLALVRANLALGKTEDAKKAVEFALGKKPDDARLQEMRGLLFAPDPVTWRLERIDASGLEPIDRLLARYQVLLNAGRTDEAQRELGEAEKLDPKNVTVVGVRFEEALAAKDYAKAQRLTEEAATGNYDQAGGALYRARLLSSQGRMRDALAQARAAVDADSFSPTKWRVLGEIQAAQDQNLDARQSLERALQIKPDDATALKAYLRVLVRLNQLEAALAKANEGLKLGTTEPEFVDIWLRLEAAVGDREKAIDRRQHLYAMNKADEANALELANLYVESRMFPQAREVLDTLRSANDSLTKAQLDARWHAEQGDLAGARAVFEKFLAATGSGPGAAEAHMAYGRFLIQRNAVEDGLKVFESARQFQGAGTTVVDEQLGDTLFLLGRFEQAAASYERALATRTSDDLLKRLAETQVRLGKFKEADKMASEASNAGTDAELLMLRGLAAEGLGDKTAARQFLDKAVASAPENTRTYLKRAELLMKDPALLPDAQADLQEAIKRDPGMVSARMMLVALYEQMGEFDRAGLELREALKVSPLDDQLRQRVVAAAVEAENFDEARQVIEAGRRLKPGSIQWMLAEGDLFAQREQWAAAEEAYGRAWAAQRNPVTARRLLEALFKAPQPNPDKIRAVLEARELKVEESVSLLLVRARIRWMIKDAPGADADVAAAYKLLNRTNARAVLAFSEELKTVYGAAAAARALRELSRREDGERMPDSVGLALARLQAQDESTRSEGIETLRAVAGTTKDGAVAATAYKFVAGLQYEAGQYDDAIANYRRALELDPNDGEAANNAAYALYKQGRTEEALELATKAAQLLPRLVNSQHTLGSVYLALKRYDEAEATLRRATTIPGPAVEKVGVLLKLAEVKSRQGDTSEARRLVEAATKDAGSSGPVLERMKPELERVRQLVGN